MNLAIISSIKFLTIFSTVTLLLAGPRVYSQVWSSTDGPVLQDVFLWSPVNYSTPILYPLQGSKNRFFRTIFRFSEGVEKKFHGKNRLKKFRRKITIFSEKIGKNMKFRRFLASTHHAPGSVSGGDFFADFLMINSKTRRFIGDFIGCFLTFRFFPGFDQTVQISSAFF